MPENGVFSCVPFCLRSLGRFARCVPELQWFKNTIRLFCDRGWGPGTPSSWSFFVKSQYNKIELVIRPGRRTCSASPACSQLPTWTRQGCHGFCHRPRSWWHRGGSIRTEPVQIFECLFHNHRMTTVMSYQNESFSSKWKLPFLPPSSLELWRKESARKAALILMKNSQFDRPLR